MLLVPTSQDRIHVPVMTGIQEMVTLVQVTKDLFCNFSVFVLDSQKSHKLRTSLFGFLWINKSRNVPLWIDDLTITPTICLKHQVRSVVYARSPCMPGRYRNYSFITKQHLGHDLHIHPSNVSTKISERRPSLSALPSETCTQNVSVILSYWEK